MKRDVGYALIAALTLTTLAALWTLVQARDIADPDADRETRGLSGSVPVRPPSPDVVEAIQQATDVLAARDLFRAAAPADMATLNRLSKAMIAPPVELVPVEPEPESQRFTAAPAPRVQAAPPPLPLSPPPPRPPVQAQQPQQPQPVAPPRPAAPTPSVQQVVTVRDARFPLTLRGVFPDPRTGGRALVGLPTGQVVTTGPGGVIQGFQVMQINAASIIVQQRGGPPYRLEMPGY